MILAYLDVVLDMLAGFLPDELDFLSDAEDFFSAPPTFEGCLLVFDLELFFETCF